MDKNTLDSKADLLFETIRNRRSVFPPFFNEDPVPRTAIEKMLRAANWAPTHKLNQPWRFIVFQGLAKRRLAEFLLQCYDENTPVELRLEKKRSKLVANPMRSSAIIAICMQTDLSRKVPEWEDLAATACAVQNLWLAATALGVSGYWSTPGSLDELSDFVGLEEGQKCLGLFYLGYASEYPDAPNRSPWDEKVQWRDE